MILIFLAVAGVATAYFVQPKLLARPIALLASAGLFPEKSVFDLIPDSSEIALLVGIQNISEATAKVSYEHGAKFLAQNLKIQNLSQQVSNKSLEIINEQPIPVVNTPTKMTEEKLQKMMHALSRKFSIAAGVKRPAEKVEVMKERMDAVKKFPLFAVVRFPIQFPVNAALLSPEQFKSALMQVLRNSFKDSEPAVSESADKVATFIDATPIRLTWELGFPVMEASPPEPKNSKIFITALGKSTAVFTTDIKTMGEIIDAAGSRSKSEKIAAAIKEMRDKTLFLALDADAAIKAFGAIGEMARMFVSSLSRLDLFLKWDTNSSLGLNGTFEKAEDAQAALGRIQEKFTEKKGEQWIQPTFQVNDKMASVTFAAPLKDFLEKTQQASAKQEAVLLKNWQFLAGLDEIRKKQNLKFHFFNPDSDTKFAMKRPQYSFDGVGSHSLKLDVNPIKPGFLLLPGHCSNAFFVVSGEYTEGAGKKAIKKNETILASPLYTTEAARESWPLPKESEPFAAYVLKSMHSYNSVSLQLSGEGSCQFDFPPAAL